MDEKVTPCATCHFLDPETVKTAGYVKLGHCKFYERVLELRSSCPSHQRDPVSDDE